MLLRLITRTRTTVLLLIILSAQACSTARTGPVPVENRSKSAEVEDRGQAADMSTSFPQPRDAQHDDQQSGKTASEAMPPVIVALLEDSERSAMRGEHEAAAATLERALRIDSKNPVLWHRLADIRLQQGNWQQALNLARRSNSLAAGDDSLQLANWQLILKVKELIGDEQGIGEAGLMIEQLKRRGAATGIRG